MPKLLIQTQAQGLCLNYFVAINLLFGLAISCSQIVYNFSSPGILQPLYVDGSMLLKVGGAFRRVVEAWSAWR